MITEVKTRPSLIKVRLQINKRQAMRCSFSIFARSAARGKLARVCTQTWQRYKRNVQDSHCNYWCILSSLFMIEPSSQSFTFYNFILYKICYITINSPKKKKEKEKNYLASVRVCLYLLASLTFLSTKRLSFYLSNVTSGIEIGRPMLTSMFCFLYVNSGCL